MPENAVVTSTVTPSPYAILPHYQHTTYTPPSLPLLILTPPPMVIHYHYLYTTITHTNCNTTNNKLVIYSSFGGGGGVVHTLMRISTQPLPLTHL
ncbi:hypothetical protein Ahia01_000999500 [Argonauta hians]